MASRNPSRWFSPKSSTSAARDRAKRWSPLRLTELEERVTPYNTFYSLEGDVDAIWNPYPVTYSYSNLLDGAIKNGTTSLTYTELTTAVEEAMGAWTAVTKLAFVEVPDSGPLPYGLTGGTHFGEDYDATGHPSIRWGHHTIEGAGGIIPWPMPAGREATG